MLSGSMPREGEKGEAEGKEGEAEIVAEGVRTPSLPCSFSGGNISVDAQPAGAPAALKSLTKEVISLIWKQVI